MLFLSLYHEVLNGLWCHGWLVHFVDDVYLIYPASSFAYQLMELEKLLVIDKITALCQTNMFIKHYIISNVSDNKNRLWKTVWLKHCGFQKPQLHWFVSIFKFDHPCILLYLLLFTFLTFWARYFLCFT